MNRSRRLPALHVVQLGCSKNLVDTERVYGEFRAAGFGLASAPEDADVVVVNTCGFIEAAKEESIQEILLRLDERRRGQRIVVAGCLSQRYREELLREIPGIDLMVGTYTPGELLGLVGSQEWATGWPCSAPSDAPRARPGDDPTSVYVKISEGCDRTCAFCAIPDIRGGHVSRAPQEIAAEINLLSERGAREAVLVAQDLTFWGADLKVQQNLADLLRFLLDETSIPWIRLTYAYPRRIDERLLHVMADSARICSYLDMPLQHGSEKMLRLMRRGHGRDELRTLLERLRSGVPGIALRTTFLLGHPGETDADFEELMEFVEETRFDRLGVFTWSPEEGTIAFDLPDRVDPDLAQERAEKLMERQREISGEINQLRVGQELTVLVDNVSEGQPWRFDARTEWDAPEVDCGVQIWEGEAEPGAFVRVRVVGATDYDLEAVVV